MKNLSQKAGLSTLYTNHSIRSTSITLWDESNIEAHHICGVSGHKSEETIKCYTKKMPPSKKREMADIISAKLGNPVEKKAKQDPNLNDFTDWVPIDNNKDDFVLADIINQIKKENES